MAAGEEAHEDLVHHVVVAHDDLLHLRAEGPVRLDEGLDALLLRPAGCGDWAMNGSFPVIWWWRGR